MYRCRKKLVVLKANYLSFGGGITLIKATLSNLIYFPSPFKILKVALELERTKTNLFGKAKRSANPQLINWNIMSRTKSMGGLGLEGLVQRNTALLGKRLWRTPREQPFDGFWLSGASLGLALMIGILLSVPILPISVQENDYANSLYFLLFTKLSLGSGNGVGFWHDNWEQFKSVIFFLACTTSL